MYSVAAWARAGSGTGLPVRSDEFGGIGFRDAGQGARAAARKGDVPLRTTPALGPSAGGQAGTPPGHLDLAGVALLEHVAPRLPRGLRGAVGDEVEALDSLVEGLDVVRVEPVVVVSREQRQPERDPVLFSLYVAFFPQLVAGPIERASSLLAELRKHTVFESSRAVAGLQLMLWGFFKKVVIADRLAPTVEQVYANPTAFSGLTLLLSLIHI